MKILIVDDEVHLANTVTRFLRREKYEVIMAHGIATAMKNFDDFQPDGLVLDLGLPDGHGLDLLQQCRKKKPEIFCLVSTADVNSDSFFRAKKIGIDAWVSKPFKLVNLAEKLKDILKSRVDISSVLSPVENPRNKEFIVNKLIGRSAKIIEMFDVISKCARADGKTVLILGESGTGKELVAKAIHEQSPRSSNAFGIINCAAIPETLLENELFGHEEGAYTGAKLDSKGLFERCNGGTVFLDEIGDMTLAMQAKVLRVLENRTLTRLGGESEIKVDVTVLAATNRDLSTMVADKLFRSDLFYRLNTLTINIPSLHERKDCILALCEYFIENFNREFGREVKGIDPNIKEKLLTYEWPGNVRELRNAIENAFILESRPLLELKSFFERIESEKKCNIKKTLPDESNGQIILPIVGVDLRNLEENLIYQALERCNGNNTAAAKLLNLSRDAFRRRLVKYKKK